MRYSPARPVTNTTPTQSLLEEMYIVPVDTYETEKSNFFINKDVLDSQQNDLRCLYCGKLSASRAGRFSHERKHRRDLTREKKMKTRKSRQRGVVDIYPCEICSKEFTNKASRTKHTKKHADVIQCQICKEKFHNKMDFDWHKCDLSEEKNPIKRTRSKSRLSLYSISLNDCTVSCGPNLMLTPDFNNLSTRSLSRMSRTNFSVKSLPYKFVRHDGTSYYDELSVYSDELSENNDTYSVFTKKSNRKSNLNSLRALSRVSSRRITYFEEDDLIHDDEQTNDFYDNLFDEPDQVFEEPIYDSRIFDETSVCPENYCSRIFTNIDLLTFHEMHEHGKLALFRCVECRKRYTTSENLAKHRAIHYHQQSIPCPLCKVLQPAKDIVSHQNKHMKNCIKCNICDLYFFDDFSYQSHFPEHFLFIKDKVQILFRINSSYGNMKVDKNFDEFLGDLSFNTIFFDNLIDKSSMNDIKDNKPWRN